MEACYAIARRRTGRSLPARIAIAFSAGANVGKLDKKAPRRTSQPADHVENAGSTSSFEHASIVRDTIGNADGRMLVAHNQEPVRGVCLFQDRLGSGLAVPVAVDEPMRTDLQVPDQRLSDFSAQESIVIPGDKSEFGALLDCIEKIAKRLAKLRQRHGVVNDVAEERDGFGVIFVHQDPEALGSIIGLRQREKLPPMAMSPSVAEVDVRGGEHAFVFEENGAPGVEDDARREDVAGSGQWGKARNDKSVILREPKRLKDPAPPANGAPPGATVE